MNELKKRESGRLVVVSFSTSGGVLLEFALEKFKAAQKTLFCRLSRLVETWIPTSNRLNIRMRKFSWSSANTWGDLFISCWKRSRRHFSISASSWRKTPLLVKRSLTSVPLPVRGSIAVLFRNHLFRKSSARRCFFWEGESKLFCKSKQSAVCSSI